MRYAVFGDVHANEPALALVLEDAARHGCERFLCTGDIVGYHREPGACIELIRRTCQFVVKGNHDADAVNNRELTGINPKARESLDWTRQVLTDCERRWLGSLPLVLTLDDLTLVHATLDSPEQWGYVLNRFDAAASMAYQRTPLCFIGHTHLPKVYVQIPGEAVSTLPEDEEIPLRPAHRYLVNVGSVGLPRDGSNRPAYAIYDDTRRSVRFRRV